MYITKQLHKYATIPIFFGQQTQCSQIARDKAYSYCYHCKAFSSYILFRLTPTCQHHQESLRLISRPRSIREKIPLDLRNEYVKQFNCRWFLSPWFFKQYLLFVTIVTTSPPYLSMRDHPKRLGHANHWPVHEVFHLLSFNEVLSPRWKTARHQLGKTATGICYLPST